MTIAYSQKESRYLADLKQVATVAAMNQIVSFNEIDAFEAEVLVNEEGIQGLSAQSHELIEKIESYIDAVCKEAC